MRRLRHLQEPPYRRKANQNDRSFHLQGLKRSPLSSSRLVMHKLLRSDLLRSRVSNLESQRQGAHVLAYYSLERPVYSLLCDKVGFSLPSESELFMTPATSSKAIHAPGGFQSAAIHAPGEHQPRLRNVQNEGSFRRVGGSNSAREGGRWSCNG